MLVAILVREEEIIANARENRTKSCHYLVITFVLCSGLLITTTDLYLDTWCDLLQHMRHNTDARWCKN